jgi:hypothetical protein
MNVRVQTALNWLWCRSGLLRPADPQADTHVSEKHGVSISTTHITPLSPPSSERNLSYGFSWLRTGSSSRFFTTRHGNNFSCHKKGREFLKQMSNYQLLTMLMFYLVSTLVKLGKNVSFMNIYIYIYIYKYYSIFYHIFSFQNSCLPIKLFVYSSEQGRSITNATIFTQVLSVCNGNLFCNVQTGLHLDTSFITSWHIISAQPYQCSTTWRPS